MAFWNKRKPETEQVPIETIDASNAPAKDEHFMTLLQDALDGKLPVFFAEVPFELIVPKDPAYVRSQKELYDKVIPALLAQAAESGLPPMWVYQQGGEFIMPDDYATYEAASRGKHEYARCLVLGEPDAPGIRNVMGPAPNVRKLLGFE